jgi:PIN domain nuclease of toxin-antitoxin system
MNLLLDTHIFLWFIAGDPRLTAPLRADIGNAANQVFLSVVSLYEVFIKVAAGRLAFPEAPEVYLPKQRDAQGIINLSLEEADDLRAPQLPSIHKDPFDRLLICQAQQNDLVFCTDDALLQTYPVKLWQPP